MTQDQSKLREYAHYYWGQQVRHRWPSEGWSDWRALNTYILSDIVERLVEAELSLRPLSEMTDEEAKEFFRLKWYVCPPSESAIEEVSKDASGTIHIVMKTGGWHSIHLDYPRLSIPQFHYLIKKGFDLFGILDNHIGDSNEMVTENKQI